MCNLHFDAANIRKNAKKMRLESGAIPMNFVLNEPAATPTPMEISNNDGNEMTQSDTNIAFLHAKIRELEQALFKEKMDREMDNLKKDERINALTEKCRDLTVHIKKLEKVCSDLDKQVTEHRDRMVQYMNGSNSNVIFTNKISLSNKAFHHREI